MKKKKDAFCVGLGILLLLGGCFFLKRTPELSRTTCIFCYICVGVGAGLFGQGMGNLISRRALKGNPDLAHQIQIEQSDERNVMITNQSKAKAFDLMTFVYGALMLAFALMQVELVALLLLVSAYLFVEGYAVYCRVKFEKEN